MSCSFLANKIYDVHIAYKITLKIFQPNMYIINKQDVSANVHFRKEEMSPNASRKTITSCATIQEDNGIMQKYIKRNNIQKNPIGPFLVRPAL